MGLLTLLAIVVACLVGSAFFSSSETALTRVDRHALEDEARAGRGPQAYAVRDLLAHISRLLVTVLLGNNLVNVLGTAAATALAVNLLGESRGIVTATIVMTLLVFIFCELLPKSVAARNPLRVSLFVSLPLYVLHQLLRPAHWLFDVVIDPLLRRITGTGESGRATSPETILRMVRETHKTNETEGGENTPMSIMSATAGAAEMTALDVMVPRAEIIAFPVSTAPADLLERVLSERYMRVPIYGETVDDIHGVCHLKDLIRLVREGGDELVDGVLKPVLSVPERKPILEMLTEMQQSFLHMAIVKDEFGQTRGLCTQEDVLEEIVGEIRDEFDHEELHMIHASGDGYDVVGRVKVLDFSRETGWEIPAERGDTIGGLVFNTLGRAAHENESVEIPGFHLRILGISGTRITRVRITRVEEEEAEEPTPSAEKDAAADA